MQSRDGKAVRDLTYVDIDLFMLLASGPFHC